MPPSDLPNLALDEVERLQAELLRLVDQLMEEADQDRQQALVRRVSDCSDELQRVCEALEARARLAAREITGHIEVVLTPDQRERVRAETGVELATVMIRDHGGGMINVMPTMAPAQVLSYALTEAKDQARRQVARDVARAEFERVSGELRRDAPEQVRQEIDRMLGDPVFRKAFDPDRR